MMQTTSEGKERLSQALGGGGNEEMTMAGHNYCMHVADDVARLCLSYHRLLCPLRPR
jgi:hypothetical protein